MCVYVHVGCVYVCVPRPCLLKLKEAFALVRYGYYEDMQHLVMILDLVPGKELKEVLVLRRTIPEDEIR